MIARAVEVFLSDVGLWFVVDGVVFAFTNAPMIATVGITAAGFGLYVLFREKKRKP